MGLFGSRRYDVEVSDDFPKRTERSVFIGKVAESSQEVFLDVDQLTKHTVIAGITGGGKTLAGNVIVEGALNAGASAIIVDPTLQWTGIIKEDTDEQLRQRYDEFHMHNDESKGLRARILSLRPHEDWTQALDLQRLAQPGVATVVLVNELSPELIDTYVCALIQRVRTAQQQSRELRLLLVFEEVHIILPKFGGTGKGFVEIERGCREFRERGVGLLLLSQVLEDFLGSIRGNINTEIQMRTTFDEDLAKARLKYGEKVADCIMRCQTGTGLFHNAEYNIGRPFFLTFRPPFHNPNRLPEQELREYFRLAALLEQKRAQQTSADTLRIAEEQLMSGKLRACASMLDDTPK
jgi:hypothetical protein